MRSFLTLAAMVGATVAACAGQPAKSGAGAVTAGESAAAPVAVPVPASCDDPAAAATAARAGDDPGEKTAAVFQLAECEQLRWGAMALDSGVRAEFESKLEQIAALYAEAGGGAVPKYVIGAHVRTGDLYTLAVAHAPQVGAAGNAAGYKQKAKESYENGLVAADTTDENTRLDLDISDWVKAGCKGLHTMGGQERRFKVCNPWKGSWR